VQRTDIGFSRSVRDYMSAIAARIRGGTADVRRAAAEYADISPTWGAMPSALRLCDRSR
jgi:hypothetical protein